MKKSIGIVRSLDQLGRLVIPKEIIKSFQPKTDTNGKLNLEIFVDGETICLRPYNPGCYICTDVSNDVSVFKGKLLCSKCLNDLKK